MRTTLIVERSCDEIAHTIISLNGQLGGATRLEGMPGLQLVDGSEDSGLSGLTRGLKILAPDLVVTYGWGGTNALVAARMAGIPVLHAEDGFLPDESIRQRPRRLVARAFLFRLARTLICPSVTLVDLARRTWHLSDKSITYIPNGVDTTAFYPPTQHEQALAKRRLGFDVNQFVIGSVGRLSIEKNQSVLIHAFATFRRSLPGKLILVGDGPQRTELLRTAAELGVCDDVCVTGWTEDTVSFYHAFDLFVLTSDTEQMPLSILEAMATGLPILSSDVGDVRSMVSARNRSRMVRPRDVAGLTEAMISLSNDALERRHIGLENRVDCEARFTLCTMINSYLRLYRETLESVRS